MSKRTQSENCRALDPSFVHIKFDQPSSKLSMTASTLLQVNEFRDPRHTGNYKRHFRAFDA